MGRLWLVLPLYLIFLTTRKADSDLGTRITVDGGTFTDCIPYGAAPGTNHIEIKDLFYNTPARRKF